jgi:hypothetical protein
LLEVPQPKDDDSPIIIELDFLSHSVRQTVNALYVPTIGLAFLTFGQIVDQLCIADKLSMTETVARLRSFMITCRNPGMVATPDRFWDLLVYASRQDDPSLVKAAIRHLGPSGTIDSVLLRPRLDRFDSVTPRYVIAILRSAVKLGPTATWKELADDFDVSDAATSNVSQNTKRSFSFDRDSDTNVRLPRPKPKPRYIFPEIHSPKLRK